MPCAVRSIPIRRRPERLDAGLRRILGAQGKGPDDVGLDADLLDPVGRTRGLA